MFLFGPCALPHRLPLSQRRPSRRRKKRWRCLMSRAPTLFADEGWLRLVRLARGEPISPVQAAAGTKALREFLHGVVKATSSAGTRCTPWTLRGDDSRFAITGSRACLGSGRLRWFSRAAAEPVRFTEGAARLQLSAQQREVALMIALRQTNAEIAGKLGVSVNTAGYHVKRVFAKLDVHDRSEVAAVYDARDGVLSRGRRSKR